MSRTFASSALIALALLSTGCAQTYTIRDLGHPEFVPLVGAETRYQRADAHESEKQKGKIDAFPKDLEGDHRTSLFFVPDGTEEEIVLTIRIGTKPVTGLPLSQLGVAIYALAAADVAAYERDGKIPTPESPITMRVMEQKDPQGGLAIRIALPRTALPPDAAKLACPLLVRFEDGWISLLFCQTGIPAVVPRGDPEALLKLHSIRDLGHPQFEEVLGTEAKYQRADLRQEGSVDALPTTAKDSQGHRFRKFTQPTATPDKVEVDVRIMRHPQNSVPPDLLAVAAYPLPEADVELFTRSGSLASPDQPLALVVQREVTAPEGVLRAVLSLERSKLPAGCKHLAVTYLVRFEDGWIHVEFLEVPIPPS
jgi:hypothetical protein